MVDGMYDDAALKDRGGIRIITCMEYRCPKGWVGAMYAVGRLDKS